MAEQEHPADQRVHHCYRHQERETRNTCARCDRPICPDCMISAAVGYQCPECVRGVSSASSVSSGSSGSSAVGAASGWQRVRRAVGGGGASRANQPRTIAGGTQAADPSLITKILIALNVAIFIAAQIYGDRLVEALVLFGRAATSPFDGAVEGVAEGQWYRLLSSMFLHQDAWHVAMNMIGLWFLGPPLEAALGRLRFTAVYLLSGLGGSVLTYFLVAPNQPSLGASGAIFGLFGAMVVLMRRLHYDMRPILVLIGINLVFTFSFSGIAWQAHIGGLVVGGLIALAMVHAPRERRTLVQVGVCALTLVVIAGVCVLRTYQLTP
jgi:membrane associated rhomboid family serine protease